MGKIVSGIQSFALALGAPGLFIITFLDSSFLSFPEATDLLLVYMVTQHKTRVLLYASAAVLGSIAGCLALYSVGRKGGEALVRSRFKTNRVDRALGIVQKYGVLAIIIPSLLPPPMPFKIFVLLSGIGGVSPARFVTAVAVGRGSRYFGEAFLAVEYGDRAAELLRENAATVGLLLAGLATVGAVAYVLWSKAQGHKGR